MLAFLVVNQPAAPRSPQFVPLYSVVNYVVHDISYSYSYMENTKLGAKIYHHLTYVVLYVVVADQYY